MKEEKSNVQKLRKLRNIVVVCVALIVLGCYGLSQAPAVQEKLASLKQSAAQNKQRLTHYRWTETQQITFKGEPKGAKEFVCRYGADGQVVKTPIGAQE